MDEKELKEIFDFLQGAGANPMICDTDVPYFEAAVRAGLPTENWAEESFAEMMSLPRKMLVSNPAMILDVAGDSMVDAGINDGDRVLVMMTQKQGSVARAAPRAERQEFLSVQGNGVGLQSCFPTAENL